MTIVKNTTERKWHEEHSKTICAKPITLLCLDSQLDSTKERKHIHIYNKRKICQNHFERDCIIRDSVRCPFLEVNDKKKTMDYRYVIRAYAISEELTIVGYAVLRISLSS